MSGVCCFVAGQRVVSGGMADARRKAYSPKRGVRRVYRFMMLTRPDGIALVPE